MKTSPGTSTRPIDFIDHQSDINQKRAVVDGDGRIGKKAVAAIIPVIEPRQRDVEGIHQRDDFKGNFRTVDPLRPVLEIDDADGCGEVGTGVRDAGAGDGE